MSIYFGNEAVYGWDAAIRGMRNPKESWEKSDTRPGRDGVPIIGEADMVLMQKLIRGGTEHSKFMRMILVTADINAPLYWWKEFDTYKVGTTANSTSTMHTLHKKDLDAGDFSCEDIQTTEGRRAFMSTVYALNRLKADYEATGNKAYWREMIELLPTSFNQKRTVSLNYAVLRNMYFQRRNHKLSEWRNFTDWAKSLPYGQELIAYGENRT